MVSSPNVDVLDRILAVRRACHLLGRKKINPFHIWTHSRLPLTMSLHNPFLGIWEDLPTVSLTTRRRLPTQITQYVL